MSKPDYPKCPKCGGFIPNNIHPGAYPGALSREDNKTEICSKCGTREALEAFAAAHEEKEHNCDICGEDYPESEMASLGGDHYTPGYAPQAYPAVCNECDEKER